MKANFIPARYISLRRHPYALQRVLSPLVVACLLSVVTTGCHFGHGSDPARELHYGQLEQACFGYEPTVWRSLSGDCAQAVRMIPNEVIQTPPKDAAPAESVIAPPAEQTPSMLPLIPEPGQDGDALPGILRDVMPPDEGTTTPESPTTEPPTTEPAAEPTTEPAAEPATEPAAEPAKEEPNTEAPAAPEPAQEPPAAPAEPAPAESLAPAAAPAPAPEQPKPIEPAPAAPQLTPSEEPKADESAPVDAPQNPPSQNPPAPPVRPVRPLFSPTSYEPAKGASVAANGLFRSVERALGKPIAATKPAREAGTEPQSTIGLARFISYERGERTACCVETPDRRDQHAGGDRS